MGRMIITNELRLVFITTYLNVNSHMALNHIGYSIPFGSIIFPFLYTYAQICLQRGRHTGERHAQLVMFLFVNKYLVIYEISRYYILIFVI